jgi:glycosyltransferase involved in cell wall biosynthesis
MKSSLIILTKNEIKGARALFDKIPFNSFDETIVIDYKSDDGTPNFFLSKGISVVNQKEPGRGTAMKLASEIAMGDILVFFSPDGNENPSDAPKLKNLIADGNDLAIASRFLPESFNEEDKKIFKFRAWANRFFTACVRFFWGGKVSDTINGFRAIRKEGFKELNIDQAGFSVEFQMTIRALKKGFKIAEIPTIEGQRLGGQSTARAIPTGIKVLKVLVREILNK